MELEGHQKECKAGTWEKSITDDLSISAINDFARDAFRIATLPLHSTSTLQHLNSLLIQAKPQPLSPPGVHTISRTQHQLRQHS
jgi:hypothetical protein